MIIGLMGDRWETESIMAFASRDCEVSQRRSNTRPRKDVSSRFDKKGVTNNDYTME